MQNIRIAMIDDNLTVLAVNEAIIKRKGVLSEGDVLHKFSSGDAFLKTFNSEMPDYYNLVLCDHDLGMGETKGLEILKYIQEKGYDGELALLTGDDSLGLSFKVAFAGRAIRYITKDNDRTESGTLAKLCSLIEETIAPTRKTN